MSLSIGEWIAIGAAAAIMLKGRRKRRSDDVISAATRWIGASESDPRVQDLVAEYVWAWKWETMPAPGTTPDWCGLIVMEWIREGLDLPPWDISKFKAPDALHPWGAWYGSVAQILQIANERPGLSIVTTPRAGDVYLSDDLTHAGLVAAVNGSRLTTIDGNWSGAVGSRDTSTTGKIYIRWDQ